MALIIILKNFLLTILEQEKDIKRLVGEFISQKKEK
jgi:hypothetical protein